MSRFLFDCIAKMSTGEKVFFKRMANIHDTNKNKNYLKLYNLLDRMTTYNSDQLLEDLEGTTLGKHLSSESNYLKSKILISLFLYNLNQSKYNKIEKGILMIKVLMEKEFRSEAMKILRATKKKAMRLEQFTPLLRLIEIEEKIHFKEGVIGYKQKLITLRLERQNVISAINNLNDFRILREELRELQFSKRFIIDDFDNTSHLHNNILIKSIKSCLSKKAKEHWYYIQVLVEHLKRNFEKSLDASVDYILFLDDNMDLFSSKNLLPAISNYLYQAALTKNSIHFERGKVMLLKLMTQGQLSKLYMDYILYTRLLEIAYYSKELEKSAEYLPFLIELIDKNYSNLESAQLQYVYMIIVRACIELKLYDKGMEYLFKWQNTGVRQHKQLQQILFSIIINSELSTPSLVKKDINRLKSAKAKNQAEIPLISAFIKYYNALLKQNDEKKAATVQFQKTIKIVSKNQNANFDFVSFDFYHWSLQLSY